MDDASLEQLLNEEEGASLDFKRDQYRFTGASDEQKAELLKDILAFANAWRRDTAFVLIGVEEVRGGRSRPVGVQDHLNDHDLQQFVGGKTNRPVMFRYIAYPFQGVQLGILEIPIQERPLYLIRRFGGIPERTVLVRRGSSTAVAEPDEIARMGASGPTIAHPAPTLSLQWGEPHSRRLLGAVAAVGVEVLKPGLSPHALRSPMAILGLNDPERDYPHKLIAFTFESRIVRPLLIVIHNGAQAPAHAVTVGGTIPKAAGMRLLDWPPQRPWRFGIDLPTMRFRSPMARPAPDVDEHADHWTITVPFGTVRPGQTIWTDHPIYIGADHTTRVELPLQILAENIPVPLDVTLAVDVAATTRPMQVQDTHDPDEY
jgi:hypothetical protein